MNPSCKLSKMLQIPLERQLPAPKCYKFHKNLANSMENERFQLQNVAKIVEMAASSSKMLQIARKSGRKTDPKKQNKTGKHNSQNNSGPLIFSAFNKSHCWPHSRILLVEFWMISGCVARHGSFSCRHNGAFPLPKGKIYESQRDPIAMQNLYNCIFRYEYIYIYVDVSILIWIVVYIYISEWVEMWIEYKLKSQTTITYYNCYWITTAVWIKANDT